MIYLHNTVQSFGSSEFESSLKQELEQLAAEQLPLQAGLSHSSYVADSPFTVMLLSVLDRGDSIQARVGVFYAGIIAGCNCADDPTPVDTQNEYCEIGVEINKQSALAQLCLID